MFGGLYAVVNAVVLAGVQVQINYFNGKCNTNCGGCSRCMLFISLHLLFSMPVVFAG